MRRVGFKIEKETYEEQRAAGRYNPGLVVLFRDKRGNHRVHIGAGYSDDVEVYREGDETFILSKNRRLDYVGLEIFRGSQQVGEMFLQLSQDIQEILGPRGLDLADHNIIKRMSQWIE